VVPTNNVTINPATGALYINGALSPAGIGGIFPNYKLTQTEAWSLSVQQELMPGLILEVNYSATEAHHLPVFNQDVNRYTDSLIVNNGTLGRLNSNFSTIQYATSDANSIGNYGSVKLRRRFSRGFTFGALYTFGKALDNFTGSGSLDSGAAATGTGANGADQVLTNYNLAAQRGRSDFDIRQQFAFDFSWTTPKKYDVRWERALLGDWQFSGIWLLQSGLPFSVFTSQGFAPVYNAAGQVIGNKGGDYNADGSNFDVPNAPSFGTNVSTGKNNYLNGLFPASAFPVPALGIEGNLGRNAYNNEGYNNLNLTVGRLFPIRERLKIEARAEVFNLFNRTNLTGVSGDLSSGTFGQATGQQPARSLQLHLRATF
jgi:hypothetical protein